MRWGYLRFIVYVQSFPMLCELIRSITFSKVDNFLKELKERSLWVNLKATCRNLLWDGFLGLAKHGQTSPTTWNFIYYMYFNVIHHEIFKKVELVHHSLNIALKSRFYTVRFCSDAAIHSHCIPRCCLLLEIWWCLFGYMERMHIVGTIWLCLVIWNKYQLNFIP